MKKLSLLLIVFSIVACDSDDSNPLPVNPEGSFSHEIPDCDPATVPEMNCTEIMMFDDDDTVKLLLGGSDLIILAEYWIEEDTLTVLRRGGFYFPIDFLIRDPKTLVNIDTEEIWRKNH